MPIKICKYKHYYTFIRLWGISYDGCDHWTKASNVFVSAKLQPSYHLWTHRLLVFKYMMRWWADPDIFQGGGGVDYSVHVLWNHRIEIQVYN